jgi:hypothetical protein
MRAIMTAVLVACALTACASVPEPPDPFGPLGPFGSEGELGAVRESDAAVEPDAAGVQDPDKGTWTDPASGLTWQDSPTGGKMTWSNAKAHCAGLSLDGGGWHLPTIRELRTLVRDNDGPDVGCFWPDQMQGPCRWYWSSSPGLDASAGVWGVNFRSGITTTGHIRVHLNNSYRKVFTASQATDEHVRCVR